MVMSSKHKLQQRLRLAERGGLAPMRQAASGLASFHSNDRPLTAPPVHAAAPAVGRMAVSRTEAVREGMKGRGWTLLHSYGDLLWALGDKSTPNEGFTPTRIFPLAAPEGEQPANNEGTAAAAAGAPADGSAGAGVAAAAAQLGGMQLGGESGVEVGPAASRKGGAAAAEAGAAAASSGSTRMDDLLEAAVLAG